MWLLFSGDALVREGYFEDILTRSTEYAAELGARLRERIYRQVVPPLAKAIADARGLDKPDQATLQETYEASMTLLFRLLFTAYAEDKELLPYRTNGLYQSRSLKKKAKELQEVRESERGFDTSHFPLGGSFPALPRRGRGKQGMGGAGLQRRPVLAGGRGLKPGAVLEEISLTNEVFGPIMTDLLLDQTPEGWGPVDFRSLGVREFGTVYEGLLENELSIAKSHLQVDKKGSINLWMTRTKRSCGRERYTSTINRARESPPAPTTPSPSP